MELMERVQRFKRNLETDDPSAPWYRQKKAFALIAVAAVILVIVAVCCGLFAGSPAKEDSHVPEPEPRVLLPPLEWDGVCPKKSLKCPDSFKNVHPLLLVSLDGFHPDFMDRGFTPTIKNIAHCGAHAPYMYPVFPSKTFPNHYSQVTGLYPSSHGIIDNNMYDPFKRKVFKVGTPESLEPYWWQKEPIWVTANKQGKRSGLYFWPGSEVKINNTYATYYKKYNSKISFDSRVNQILSWLDLPASSRPQFMTLYVNQPDHTLHYFGTDSKQTNDVLSKVDRMIERLFSGLQQRDLLNCVNVIIMADHGMSDTDCKRLIDIQKYISASDTFNIMGPFARIRPKGRRNATLVNELVSKLRCKSHNMRAYAKEQLPVRMHYAENPRIEPIFLDIDAGWTVVSKDAKPNDSICSGGAHGYDNMFPDMRAIFLAHGPAFKQNYTIQPFINTELYEMFAELLDIIPNPNNGTKGSMHHVMTSPHVLLSQKEPEPPAVGVVPSDEIALNDRLAVSGCSCPQSEKQEPVKNIAAVHHTHLPFGTPFSQDNNSILLLYNEDYVNAYHLKFKIPLWSSFTLKEGKEYKMIEDICWKGDARIHSDNTPKCDKYLNILQKNPYILHRPLYPPGFSDSLTQEQGTYITNLVTKSLNHSKIIETSFNQILNKWVSQTGNLNVVMGPAFDFSATGIHPSNEYLMEIVSKNDPVIIPTHIFVVTTWCKVKTDSIKVCDPMKLEAHAFLLPNEPYPMNCESPENMISKNVARVVDIEKLTGISFYTGLPIYDAIRLRTMMPERAL